MSGVEGERDVDAAPGERRDDRAAHGPAAAEHERAPRGRRDLSRQLQQVVGLAAQKIGEAEQGLARDLEPRLQPRAPTSRGRR